MAFVDRIQSTEATYLMEMMEMWLLLLILLGFSSCFIITLIFGLLGAGRKADEGEEKILEIMSSTPPDKGDVACEQTEYASPSSKVLAVK
jgi:hypothetical protein